MITLAITFQIVTMNSPGAAGLSSSSSRPSPCPAPGQQPAPATTGGLARDTTLLTSHTVSREVSRWQVGVYIAPGTKIWKCLLGGGVTRYRALVRHLPTPRIIITLIFKLKYFKQFINHHQNISIILLEPLLMFAYNFLLSALLSTLWK